MAVDVPPGKVDEATARRLWWAALETLQGDILLPMGPTHGIWLASPLPALYEPRLLDQLDGWVWAPDELSSLHYPKAALLPPERARSIHQNDNFNSRATIKAPNTKKKKNYKEKKIHTKNSKSKRS